MIGPVSFGLLVAVVTAIITVCWLRRRQRDSL